jgi:hypothetical protein
VGSWGRDRPLSVRRIEGTRGLLPSPRPKPLLKSVIRAHAHMQARFDLGEMQALFDLGESAAGIAGEGDCGPAAGTEGDAIAKEEMDGERVGGLRGRSGCGLGGGHAPIH